MSDALSETPFIFSVRFIEISLGGNSKGTARPSTERGAHMMPFGRYFRGFLDAAQPGGENGAIYLSHASSVDICICGYFRHRIFLMRRGFTRILLLRGEPVPQGLAGMRRPHRIG